MLQITFSNRFETLRDALLDGLSTAPASPFATEQVIVPSSAVRRDLTLSMAARFGICANVEFGYLAQWLWRQIAKVVPTVASDSPFTTPVLTWRVFQILDDSKFVSGFPRLASYLQKADPVVRFDFSTRVAGLLEQYMTYRPAWLAEWSAGKAVSIKAQTATAAEDQAWQAALWRAITAQLDMDRDHPATRFLREVGAIGGEASHRFGLPEIAHIFCLPAIPPLYIDILHQLGRWIDLRLYVLNPCREFWIDIVDERRLSYLKAKGEDAYHETGNRLLAAWGKQTKAQIELLLEHSEDAIVDDGGFEENPSSAMLAQLQNAVLNLTELEPASISLGPTDRSIEIHVCHSLTRELEALHDQLLAIFAGPDAASPADILVVTPDLEGAAPLVDAVFGNAPRERYIPYTVTGRARSTINEPARALIALLDLATSRFPASAVFDLLQQPIIRDKAGISADELDSIQDWIKASGIRWAIDGKHRGQHDLPATERYTFDDGIHRLFMGYALPNAVLSPWHDRVPAGNAEGSEAMVLGRFAKFVQDLSRARTELSQPKVPAAWMRALFEILDAFLAPSGNDIDDLAEVRDTIRGLHDNMARGGITTAVSLDVVRTALGNLLDDPARGGVPSGRVTFSSMSSLRNLPFRIVCAIGLNDGAFPSASRPAEFDLMALSPQDGDRQRRLDERNLFLDLILATRERLYLSYTGRSIRDNAPLPASILVSELIETMEKAICAEPFSTETRAEAHCRLVIEHPLQPFSAKYFTSGADDRTQSFNREMCEALRHKMTAVPVTEPDPLSSSSDDDEDARDSTRLQRFFREPLAEPDIEWRDVSLESLIRFFQNPCRFLLKERLGIRLSEADAELLDDEPFLPDFIGRQALAERLLPHFQVGMSDEDLRRLAAAGIEYPSGAFGESLLEAELQSLKAFAETVEAVEAAPCLPPYHNSLSFDLEGTAWRVTGAFANLRPDGLVLNRYDDTRATDYLTGWLSHLFLCSSSPPGVTLETQWVSRDGQYRLRPCDKATDILHTLVGLYRRGLSAPIHFFPKSAWEYTLGDKSLYKAENKWRSTRDRPWGEEEHTAYRLALRGVAAPIDDDFAACADDVFGSIRQYLEDPRL